MKVDLLLFSDDEEDYDDDRSFFEIAIHHKQQSSNDDDEKEEEEMELRISFSSASMISNCNGTKSHAQPDLLIISTDHQSPFCTDFSSSSFFSTSSSVGPASPDLHEPNADKTTAVQGQVTNLVSSDNHKPTHLVSDWDLTTACCPPRVNINRKSSEKMTRPTVNKKGSGILNFLIKFPAAIKFQKLVASFAKATANSNTPSEQDIATITSKTTSSKMSRRGLHKFLNKWLIPLKNELGLKNMKSYCSFDEDHCEMDHMIIITSNTEKNRKRKGISNPSSMKSSPVRQGTIDGHHDHHQSFIQAAIAHCRTSSTPDFSFKTSCHPS